MVFRFLRWAALSLCLVIAGCEDGSNASARHLLFICIDTVRADTFSRLAEEPDDPLAAWEAQGLVFTQASAPAPWTLPSIGSVLTGLWASQHRGGMFPGLEGQLATKPPSAISKKIDSLAPFLQKEEGFETAIISASSWTNVRKHSFGLMRGFNQVEPFDTPGLLADWRPMVDKWWDIFQDQSGRSRTFNFLHLMEAHNWHKITPDKLEAQLAKMSEQDRALYLRIAPARACEDQASIYCKHYLIYASAVRELRRGLAAILDKLQESDQLKDTIVVVFSDHGEEFYDHADDWRAGTLIPPEPLLAHLPYMQHGGTLYEEQLHVPLLIWSPQLAGASIDQPVSLVDVAPTVARWLDVDFQPENWPGRYLDDYLVTPEAFEDRVVYASAISLGPQQISARQGRDKSIWHIAADRSEYFDLAARRPEQSVRPADAQVLAFDGHFVDFVQSSPKVALEPGVLSAEQARRLQSIGYLQGLEIEEESGAD